MEAYIENNIDALPEDPFTIFAKLPDKAPYDPFQLCEGFSSSWWKEVGPKEVIITCGSSDQLQKVMDSCDKTLYIDTTHRTTKYALKLVTALVYTRRNGWETIAHSFVSRETNSNLICFLEVLKLSFHRKTGDSLELWLKFAMHDDAQTTLTPAVEYSFPSMEHLLCLVHLADALSQAIDPSKTGMDVSRYDRITKNFYKLARDAHITPL